MVNKITLSEHDILEVSRRYDLGQVRGEPKPEKRGETNNNFIFDTSSGLYMVRGRNDLGAPEIRRRHLEHAVTDYLHEHGFEYEIPHFRENESGKKMTFVDDNVFEVYPRLPGRTGKSGVGWTPDELIEVAAKYHRAMKDFPEDTKKRNWGKETYDDDGRLYLALEWMKRESSGGNTPEDLVVRKNMPLIYDAYGWLMDNGTPNGPETVIHGDIHPGNVLYTGEDLTGVIDFGNVKWNPLEGDMCRIADCESDELKRRIDLYQTFNEMGEHNVREIVPRAVHQKLNAINWAYRGLGRNPERRLKMLTNMTERLDLVMGYHAGRAAA